jgi:hypothetical protein
MGVPRKHVNELCNGRRAVTAATALILARVFGNTPDFWLNVQRRTDLWDTMNDPRERERVKRAKPLRMAAGPGLFAQTKNCRPHRGPPLRFQELEGRQTPLREPRQPVSAVCAVGVRRLSSAVPAVVELSIWQSRRQVARPIDNHGVLDYRPAQDHQTR